MPKNILQVLTKTEIINFDSPPQFSAAQQQKFFTITEELQSQINKLHNSSNQVFFVLQWGYFVATGKFFAAKYFHQDDLKYIATQLEINPATINIKQCYINMLCHHQKVIMSMLGFKAFNCHTKSLLRSMIDRQVQQQSQPKKIIYNIAAQMHNHKIEIPNYNTILLQLVDSYNANENRLLSIIHKNISKNGKKMLEQLLQNDGPNTLTTLQHWKNINQSTRVMKIQSNIEMFTQITEHFKVFAVLLKKLDLTPEAVEYFATWVKKAKLSQIQQFNRKDKMYLYLLAFVQHQYYLYQDALITIFTKCARSTHNKAKNAAKTQNKTKQKEHHKAVHLVMDSQENQSLLLEEIYAIVQDAVLNSEDRCDTITLLLEQHYQNKAEAKIAKEKAARESVRNNINELDYYAMLEKLSIKLQRRVSSIVKSIDFNLHTSDANIIKAIAYFKNKDGDIDQDAPLAFLNKQQLVAVRDDNGKIKLTLYKALLFMSIDRAIRSGKLNLEYSYSNKALQDYMLEQDDWNANKDQLISEAGLEDFIDVETVLNNLQKEVDDKYHKTNQNILSNRNKHIKFENDGKFILKTPKLERTNDDGIPSLLLDTGFVPILQVLHNVNHATNFADQFTHYSVKHNKLKPDLNTIFAGIMAQGCNIGVHKMPSISKGVSNHTLTNTMNWFFTLDNIKQANQAVTNLITRLSLSKIFKHTEGVTHSSSDGRKIIVAAEALLANFSYKYFGKAHGVNIYTHIDDTQSLLSSKIISFTEREAMHMIDGLRDYIKKDSIHSTDTHGYTELIFALTHAIGVNFSPRIKKLNKQCLYGFHSKIHYKKLGYKILPSRTINTKLIREHWDEILRFFATIKLGKSSTSQLLSRLNSYAKDKPLYKALQEFGRIMKTNFVLTYIDNMKLRQRIEKQLNRVELANKFAKAVFFANNQEFKIGYKEEQEIAVACKILIQNSIVLWNYLHLSEKLALSSKEEQEHMLKVIKQGSVISWAHINLHGEYNFEQDAINDPNFNMTQILKFKLDPAFIGLHGDIDEKLSA